MNQTHKVTKDEYAMFVAYCKTLIRKLGLNDWHIAFFNTMPNGDDDIASLVIPCVQGKIAQISLNPEWPEAVTDEMTRYAAAHEICHLLLSDITTSSLYGEEIPSHVRRNIDRAEHAAVNRLVPLLLKELS